MTQLWIPKNRDNLDPIEVAPPNGDGSDRHWRRLGRSGFPRTMKQQVLETYFLPATDEERAELLDAA